MSRKNSPTHCILITNQIANIYVAPDRIAVEDHFRLEMEHKNASTPNDVDN